MAVAPLEPNKNSLTFRIGKQVETRATGWGVLGAVVVVICLTTVALATMALQAGLVK